MEAADDGERRAGGPPGGVMTRTQPGPRSSAFLARTLRTIDAQLEATLPRVVGKRGAPFDGTSAAELRRGQVDAEGVHDMRVAIRRLRTLLRLARPVYGRFHSDAVRVSFARLQQATGDLRDEEALEETLGELGVKHPAFDAWQERRRGREKALRAAVIRRIRTGQLRRPRAMLHALVVLPVDPENDEPLTTFARRSIARACKDVEAHREVPPEDVQAMHDLRIAYKKLRYAAEFFAEALPPELAAMAEMAARFQKRLGEIHDVDMALAAIRRSRSLEPEARQLVLAALENARARKVRKYKGELAPPQIVRGADSLISTASVSER